MTAGLADAHQDCLTIVIARKPNFAFKDNMKKTGAFPFPGENGPNRHFHDFAVRDASDLRIGQRGKQRRDADLLNCGGVHTHNSPRYS